MILAATICFASLLTCCHYHPLQYRHATDTHTNIQQRHHFFDQLPNQAAESAVTFHKGTEQSSEYATGTEPSRAMQKFSYSDAAVAYLETAHPLSGRNLRLEEPGMPRHGTEPPCRRQARTKTPAGTMTRNRH